MPSGPLGRGSGNGGESKAVGTDRRKLTAIAFCALVALTSVFTPTGAAASSGSSQPTPGVGHWDVPPPIADGPITLPSGKVLAVPPRGSVEYSIQAEMLAAHSGDRPSFVPGARPEPMPGSLARVGGETATALNAPSEPRLSGDASTPSSMPNGLRKEVLGFLPYWFLGDSDLQWMQYQLVSTIAYFGVAANADGSLATTSSGWSGWNSSAMTGVINSAHARGVRVVLTVTMMAWDGGAAQASLLGSSAARERLVGAIVAAVRNRNADGVNLDFEPVYTAQRDQYTSFVRQLKAALVAGGVGSYLTVCTTAGAATWSSGYDVSGLVAAGASDALFVMGYDYSWSGSARAGGVAPMDSPYILDVGESVRDFLDLIPGNKVIWGVPYYGRTWHTTSDGLNSPTVSGASGQSKAYYYTGNLKLALQHGHRWDSVGQVPWFSYWDTTAATWVQGYYDDVASLSRKWDMVNDLGLLGTGMWTLLMDQGTSDLWNLIAGKFVTDTTPPTGGVTTLPAMTDAHAALVSWRAVDVGSGVASYTIESRDVTAATDWTNWLSNTTRTSAYWIGVPGHTYDFRVSAIDNLGNRQPWQSSIGMPTSVTPGAFAQVVSDTLNVRAAAGTSFTVLDRLSRGDRVAVLSGPVAAGGYQWFSVQFGFAEWPSSDYPRTGWVAAGSGATAYLLPTSPVTQTRLAPSITDYAVSPVRFQPSADMAAIITVRYRLSADAASVRLDVVNGASAVIRSYDLGGKVAGAQSATWDGRTSTTEPAPPGRYLLRITAVDTATHVSPAAGVDAAVLATWGVESDLTRPTVLSRTPAAGVTTASMSTTVTIGFSEPVSGVNGTSVRVRDTLSGGLYSGTVTYDPGTATATFVGAFPFQPARRYQVELSGAIGDSVGNPLLATSWSWTTTAWEVYSPWRSVRFSPASFTGYRFYTGGVVAAMKAWVVTADTVVQVSRRARIPGQPNVSGAWYFLESGPLAGWWVRERWSNTPAGFNPTLL